MKCRMMALASLTILVSCTTIVDEKTTTAVLSSGFNAGTEYQIRTRQLQGSGGTYTQTSVVYRGVSQVCILDSPGDCESAARDLIDGRKVRSAR